MMKAVINPPSLAMNSFDYQTECQFALEPSVRGLLAKAEDAGWDRRHAAMAILNLVFGDANQLQTFRCLSQ